MMIDRITNDDEHQEALNRVLVLMRGEPDSNTPEGAELDELADAIVEYEEVRYPIGADS